MLDTRNLSDRIYFLIRNKIVNNEMAPGTRIQYEELINELGVSRTPLRDAINRLQQDGLIEVKPRSGTFVSVPKEKDIIEIYDLRKSLELLALELSFKRIPTKVIDDLFKEIELSNVGIDKGDPNPFFTADRLFHRTLIKYSNNQRLIQIMDTLEVQIQWFGIIITKNFTRPKQANELHIQILTAMKEENLEIAKELMARHIEDIKEYTIADYS
ncbi:GntR family transcriptional regulator [bacterium LRH843]|nr:GntR family transcriptional regulator [bacterium LRH843]